MCGSRSYAGHGMEFDVRRRHGGHGDLFGIAVEKMSVGARVGAGLSVVGLVALSGVVLAVVAPGLWWIFTTYVWIAFPALGLLARGGGRSPGRVKPAGERELLGALKKNGEITPAGAAVETSLTVAGADRMLQELARSGHLEVRVRGGGIFYALWDGAMIDESTR